MKGPLIIFILLISAVCAAEDPPGAVMPGGPLSGQAIDTREIRSLSAVPEETAVRFRKEPGDTIVTQFKHDGKFWIARIPAGAVEAAYLQRVDLINLPAVKALRLLGIKTEEIPVIVHQQLRFKLKAGREVELFPLDGAAAAPVRIPDMVFSADASGVDNTGPFDPLKAVKQEYVLVSRLQSTPESWFTMVGRLRRPVKQYPVNLTDERRQDLLAGAIRASVGSGYSEIFGQFTNNCTTKVHELLDGVASHRPRLPGQGFLNTLPYFPTFTLRQRRMLTPGAEGTPTMNQEFTHLSTDPDMRARLRATIRADIAARRAAEANPGPKRNIAGYLCSFVWNALVN